MAPMDNQQQHRADEKQSASEEDLPISGLNLCTQSSKASIAASIPKK